MLEDLRYLAPRARDDGRLTYRSPITTGVKSSLTNVQITLDRPIYISLERDQHTGPAMETVQLEKCFLGHQSHPGPCQ